MLPMRVAVLSGYAGPRSSMFAGSASDVFSLGAHELGKSNEAWYNDAKNLVREYDDLVVRTRKIANKQVREQIAQDYIGSDPRDSNTGMYTRNGVAGNIATAESYTPVNTYYFAQRSVQNRVDRLRAIVEDFRAAVTEAEATWGSLPEPQTIETIKTVEVPVSSVPGWVPVAVAGALGVAALAWFLKKK